MEEEILKRLEEQDRKLDKIFVSVEKTRKYFVWTLIITIVMIVLPLIALGVVIPIFLNVYINALGI
jgi:t-SNARE complex subunit (syntaxin)